MKFYRFVAGEKCHLGVGHGPLIYDAVALYHEADEQPPDVVAKADLRIIASAPASIVAFLRHALSGIAPEGAADQVRSFDPGRVRLLPPITHPGKIVCVGLNYRDHCEEQNKQPPETPMLFAKSSNAVCGHGDKILKTAITAQMDYEGELGVVIGLGGRGIRKENALQHVFGYTIVNDVSARDLQYADKQWYRAKSQDTYCPMGPCVVTADEVGDPQSLALRTMVSGEQMQASNTRHMVFGVADLIAFISEGITLEPGDIISTGTPGGVGMHRTPPRFLQPGDVVEIEIERIGALRNDIAAG